MTKIDDKVEKLLAKHPSLTKPDAIKIITEKNERKKKKRVEKQREVMPKSLETRQTSPNEMKITLEHITSCCSALQSLSFRTYKYHN